jgi:hypothetical protein
VNLEDVLDIRYKEFKRDLNKKEIEFKVDKTK